MPRKRREPPKFIKDRRGDPTRPLERNWHKNKVGKIIEDPRGRLIPQSKFDQSRCYGRETAMGGSGYAPNRNFKMLMGKIRGLLRVRANTNTYILNTGRDFILEVSLLEKATDHAEKKVWILITNEEIIEGIWHLIEEGDIVEGPRDVVM